MPMYDRRCVECQKERLDCLELVNPCEVLCECGGRTERVWIMGRANNVIGDECDVLIKHALCNADGSPRRYRSRQEIARVAKERGYTSYVKHEPAPHTDKSKTTQRWI